MESQLLTDAESWNCRKLMRDRREWEPANEDIEEAQDPAEWSVVSGRRCQRDEYQL